MKTGTVGRPKNPPGGERFTLVLDAAAVEQLEKLKERYIARWPQSAPTLSVLVTRGLTLAEEAILNTPPENERLRTTQAHLRRVKADVERALATPKREALFALQGEITLQIQSAVALRGSIIARKREWAIWARARTMCEQVIDELTQELRRVADSIRNGR